MIEQVPALNLTGTDPSVPGWHREYSWLMDYPPRPGDAIVVIGAYSGTVAGWLIRDWPNAQHYLIEPQDWACRQLREKFGHLPNVHVCEHGLGDRSGRFRMALYTSYDTTFLRSETVLFQDDPAIYFDAAMVEFTEWTRRECLASIHYASINVEGFEYVLLPHLARMGWLKRIKCLGISWHDARFNCPVPGPYVWQEQRLPDYDEMQRLLPETHRLVLSIDNWQTWVRRES